MSSLVTRTRSKGDPKPRTVALYVKCLYPNGTFSWDWNQTGDIPPISFASITDEIGGLTSRALHDCYNFSYESKINMKKVSWVNTNGDQYSCDPGGCAIMDSSEWKSRMHPQYIAPSEEELAAFNRRATEAMMPKIELTMDMPTFLTEITSLPDLFKSGFVSKLLSKTKRFKKSLYRYESLGTETALAGDYLNWQFGWSPTIADAKALYDDYQNLENKLDALLSGQGKVFTSHYTEVYELDPSTYVEPKGSSQYFTYATGGLNIRLTATMRYRYKVKNIEGMSRKSLLFRARLDSLGFNNPLRTIWERVPFSFMLDWFVPVGDMLEQFRKRWIDSTVEISEYSISYKFEQPLVTKITWTNNVGGEWECGSTALSCYCRRRSLPDFDKFGLRVNNRFGSKQLLLSGALATSFLGKK